MYPDGSLSGLDLSSGLMNLEFWSHWVWIPLSGSKLDGIIFLYPFGGAIGFISVSGWNFALPCYIRLPDRIWSPLHFSMLIRIECGYAFRLLKKCIGSGLLTDSDPPPFLDADPDWIISVSATNMDTRFALKQPQKKRIGSGLPTDNDSPSTSRC